MAPIRNHHRSPSVGTPVRYQRDERQAGIVNALLAPARASTTELLRRTAGSPRWVVLVAALVVTWVGIFTSSSHFFLDDYIYFREAQREGLSFGFLLQPLNVHIAPGHRLADWALATFAPLRFGVAQVLLLACLFASVLVLHQVLARIWRPGMATLALSAWYGTSIVHVGVVQWWSAGWQSLPSGLLSLVCILLWLQFKHTGSRKALALSVTSLAAALLFYVKPVLVPLYLVLLQVLVVERDQPFRVAVVNGLRAWRIWLLYLAPVALYAAVYLTFYWQPSSPPSVGLIGEYLSVSWQRVLVPSVFGFQISPASITPAEQVLVIAGQLAVLVAIGVSMVRSRRAWRGWAFLAMVFLANTLMAGLPRIADWGAGVAYFYRYYPELTYLVPLAIAAAFARPLSPSGEAMPGHHDTPTRLRLAGYGAVLVVLVVHVAIASSAAQRISLASPGRQARPYIDNFRSDLARIERSGVRPSVVDGVVPDFIVASWSVYGPPYQNRYSEVFPLIDPQLQFDHADGPLFRVADDGHLQKVALVPSAGGWAPRLFQNGDLQVVGGPVEVTSQGLCARSPGGSVAFELQPSTVLANTELYLALEAKTDQDVTLWMDRGSGFPPFPDRTASFVGLDGGSRLVSLGSSTFERLRIDVPPGTDMCLGRLELGQLMPLGGR